MNWRTIATATLAFLLVSPVFAQPELTAVKGGIEAGNWVWQINITPDLVQAGGATPMAVELGFRLTGAPLLNVANINLGEWGHALPGRQIFGWETLTDVDPGPGVNLHPVGLQSNTATSEIFVSFGSDDFSTPGPKPFLKIVAQGPGNGGPLSSTIEWLGVYAVGKGRIAQLVNGTGQNFDIFSGTSTQFIPEPTSAGLLCLGCITLGLMQSARRRRATRELLVSSPITSVRRTWYRYALPRTPSG